MSHTHLTASEWNVLDCLWEESPQTVMVLVEKLGRKVGWAKSTTITTLRRMEEKGLIRCETVGKAKHYTPAVDREAAVVDETNSFLSRVYRGSVGMMVNTLADGRGLTQSDIDELTAILEKARRDQS